MADIVEKVASYATGDARLEYRFMRTGIANLDSRRSLIKKWDSALVSPRIGLFQHWVMGGGSSRRPIRSAPI
ncbi:hypothetical protein BQ8794_30220 [Mesorhizobium prunaredense]|uniref:Uncharacterized protein n=1 Tax=Mesorhizobium prunaredense TaxID=1631249 RepID=A0A1R3VEE3_9HYPH|nr:hypothetical protein BQ8794_30220 [Mesorhizobium prunaredense]